MVSVNVRARAELDIRGVLPDVSWPGRLTELGLPSLGLRSSRPSALTTSRGRRADSCQRLFQISAAATTDLRMASADAHAPDGESEREGGMARLSAVPALEYCSSFGAQSIRGPASASPAVSPRGNESRAVAGVVN